MTYARSILEHRTYIMIYGGCAWYVLVSGHRQPDLLEHVLTQTGELWLTHYEFTKFKPLIDIGRDRKLGSSRDAQSGHRRRSNR